MCIRLLKRVSCDIALMLCQGHSIVPIHFMSVNFSIVGASCTRDLFPKNVHLCRANQDPNRTIE